MDLHVDTPGNRHRALSLPSHPSPRHDTQVRNSIVPCLCQFNPDPLHGHVPHHQLHQQGPQRVHETVGQLQARTSAAEDWTSPSQVLRMEAQDIEGRRANVLGLRWSLSIGEQRRCCVSALRR